MAEVQTKLKIIRTMADGRIFQYEGDINVDKLKNLIGDGKSSVTVSHSQSTKVYGNGEETFVSVTASCNQDDATVERTILTLHEVTKSIISGLHSEGLAIWKGQEALNKHIMEG